MIWDKLSAFYDAFESAVNGKVNLRLVKEVAAYIDESDVVLECACGTGMVSVPIAKKCRKLLATDFSVGMLKQAKKKLREYPNVKLLKADIMNLPCKDGRFDKVVAANVIHLLDNPRGALDELMRVCKDEGKIIIPTYINAENKDWGLLAKFLEKLGVDVKREYDYEAYVEFFESLGFENVEYKLIEGRFPAAIAVITKEY